MFKEKIKVISFIYELLMILRRCKYFKMHVSLAAVSAFKLVSSYKSTYTYSWNKLFLKSSEILIQKNITIVVEIEDM